MSQSYNTSAKERYIFNFINPYKNTTYQYSFHTDVTIKYFTDFITHDLSTFLEGNNRIEIVENTEAININNNIDLLPKMNYCESSILSEIFGSRWEKTSFYIRLKPLSKTS